MNDNRDDESKWLGRKCDSSEICPRTGYWKQIETGRLIPHEVGDKFRGIGDGTNYKKANYEYMGKEKN